MNTTLLTRLLGGEMAESRKQAEASQEYQARSIKVVCHLSVTPILAGRRNIARNSTLAYR
jgi:hypothetical protein